MLSFRLLNYANVQNFFKYANIIFTIFEIIKLIDMKIKLSKNHLDHTAGDTIEVEQGIGEYLVRLKVGEPVSLNKFPKDDSKSDTKDLKQEYINKKRNPKS